MPGTDREGLTSRVSVLEYVASADAGFAAQEARASKVANIEAALGSQYRALDPVAKRTGG